MMTTKNVRLANGLEMSVGILGGDMEPILAIHGISSTGRLWLWTQAAMPELSFLCPDLRGRGATRDGGGGSSIKQHADDLVLLLDALGLERVHVVGNSMGAFVGVQMGAWHSERVRSLTLLDGGLPIPHKSPWPTRHEDIPALLKDRFDRSKVVWRNVREYADFFVSATAPLLSLNDPLLTPYLEHDLTLGAAGGKVRLDLKVFTSDAEDLFLSSTAEDAIANLKVPTRLAYAEWSTGSGSAPMYENSYVQSCVRHLPMLLSATRVSNVDHPGIIMTANGAAAGAEVIRRSLGLIQA